MEPLRNAILQSGAIAELQHAVCEAIRQYESTRVHIVQTDEWFGPKWLGFSGKLLGALETFRHVEQAPRVPPFHPHRVVVAAWFEKTTDGWTEIVAPPLNIHLRSEVNTRRRFSVAAGPNTTAVWFGGDRKSQHCALVYSTMNGDCAGWYVGVDQTSAVPKRVVQGISIREYESLVATAA